jgi:predicted dehydrogenase
MTTKHNWGILALGGIAHKFASALNSTENGELFAVGSRSIDKAEKFASQYGSERWYGSYEELIHDQDVQIIYIATPHNLHYELTKKCFEAGKHVLCEKPISINHRQFDELRKLAKSKNLFYMDGLWTRFLPHVLRKLEYLENQKLGVIQFLKADFGIKPPYNPKSRLFDPKLGGGALLDIGIYPVFLSLLVLGYPDEISASAIIGETGVDESISISLKYQNGAIASLNSTFRVNTETSAEICGTHGRIKMNRKFFAPSSLTVYIEGEGTSEHDFSVKKNGYEYEAEEAMRCLDEGLIESPYLPLEFTSDLMSLLDEIRERIGLVYEEDR